MLFSIDRCFRREQAEDETHLRSHHSASCVICDEEVALGDGEAVARGLLKPFGFSDFKFRPDEKRSKYYAPGTQTEVYARHPRAGWVEIATFGLYSPVALSNYKIEYPVMNLGLGVERLAMVLSGARDVREMVYPQFYARVDYTDEELAGMLRFKKAPATEEGRALAGKIAEVARAHAGDASPCEVTVYQGDFLGREAVVRLVEREEGTRLLGPAALNAVYVRDGTFIGTDRPEEGMTPTGITYIDAVAALAAAEIEEGAREGRAGVSVRVPMVKSLGDINLELDEAALRYIMDRSKKVDVRGPVFTAVEADFG
ncbi:MAG: O-phosphoserine--tRNA ligase, partial [Euryarchaeota archaeon]|nr:O-phosphoserine--tRNA ligase [Euryarchaeota archaeon]